MQKFKEDLKECRALLGAEGVLIWIGVLLCATKAEFPAWLGVIGILIGGIYAWAWLWTKDA